MVTVLIENMQGRLGPMNFHGGTVLLVLPSYISTTTALMAWDDWGSDYPMALMAWDRVRNLDWGSVFWFKVLGGIYKNALSNWNHHISTTSTRRTPLLPSALAYIGLNGLSRSARGRIWI